MYFLFVSAEFFCQTAVFGWFRAVQTADSPLHIVAVLKNACSTDKLLIRLVSILQVKDSQKKEGNSEGHWCQPKKHGDFKWPRERHCVCFWTFSRFYDSFLPLCFFNFSLWATNNFSEQYSQNGLQITGVLAGVGVAECSLCKFNEIKTVHGECCLESGLAWRVPLLQVHRNCFFQCFFSSAHSKSSLLRFCVPICVIVACFSCWYLHFHKH